MLKVLALFGIIMIMFLFLSCTPKSVPIKKILIVTGGHEFERDAFFTMFNGFSELEYKEALQPQANQLYGSPSMDNYNAIVFYDMVQDITKDQQAALIHLLEKGKGMVFLHHSLASYQEWDEFMSIIGGRYHLEADKKDVQNTSASTYQHDVDIQVNIADTNHPVTAGLNDFMIHDEVYGKFSVLPTVHSLLSTDHPESGEIIGWTNVFGKSRIVYIQLGHDHHAFQDPNYRRLIKQTIDWVSGE